MELFGNPATSDTDAVRFLCGDTIGVPASRQLVQNEEIAFLLTLESDVTAAAAAACEAIAGRLGAQVDKRVGDLDIKASQRAEAFRVKATDLRAKAALACGAFGGGISLADKQTRRQDSDAVMPAFTRDQFENPGTVPSVRRSGPNEWDWS